MIGWVFDEFILGTCTGRYNDPFPRAGGFLKSLREERRRGHRATKAWFRGKMKTETARFIEFPSFMK